jgi:hypothetical protein
MTVKDLLETLADKNPEHIVTEIDCIFFVGPDEDACFAGRQALEGEGMMPEDVKMLNR